MMQGFARTLITGGLVEHQAGELGIGPIDPINGKNQAGGFALVKWVITKLAVDRDPIVTNEGSAFLAGTKSMFLEDSF
jgi:hypothetical protein